MQSQHDTSPTSSTTECLPEFTLKGKTIIVSGGARGLGLIQAEALLEAGATGFHSRRADNQLHVTITADFYSSTCS
jgi:short-subunit dehydrogenase involved in D-alanine esterification of teichoic acids